jgi:hypothetical protein
MRRSARRIRCGGWVNGGRLAARVAAQSRDGVEEYPPMTNGTDADFL